MNDVELRLRLIRLAGGEQKIRELINSVDLHALAEKIPEENRELVLRQARANVEIHFLDGESNFSEMEDFKKKDYRLALEQVETIFRLSA